LNHVDSDMFKFGRDWKLLVKKEITLINIYYLIRQNIIWVVGSMVVGLVAFFTVSMVFMTSMYTSSTDMYIYNAQKFASAEQEQQAATGDISFARALIPTYTAILKSDGIMEEVSAKLTVKMSPSQIRKSISFSSEPDTMVLRITAKTDDPLLSAEICNAIGDIAPEYLVKITKTGGAEVYNRAIPATSKSSPNVRNNSIVGALLGLALSVGVLLLIFIFDNTIKGEEDIKMYLDIPVLGEIPTLETLKKGD